MAIPILIDCDPGVDDAVMLLLALASPEIEVLAITTVGGNVPGALTAQNARAVRDLAGSDVPVFEGCAGPMLREPVDAGRFHGESGLGPLVLAERDDRDGAQADLHGVDAIIRTVISEPERSVTIVVTGPMTNLAVAMLKEPRLAGRVARVVAMGGARSAGGNITASAEFNIFADPHAAEIVLRSGCEMVMFGLDVTHQVRCTEARVATIAALPGARARAAAELMAFSNGVMREVGIEGGAPLHDPCPIAWLIDPSLFETRPCTIRVETGSALAMGHTAVEFREPGNHHWAVSADAPQVFALLTGRLA